MSGYFTSRFASLEPYVPGEQPKNREYIKLNTNENPYPPSNKAVEHACKAAESLELYSDPDCTLLCEKLAEVFGVEPDEVIAGNGSDEILNFAFSSYCDENTPAVFADITYGFYPVFAEINRVPYKVIPLGEDFRLNPADYYNAGGTVFIANPNAPTSSALTRDEIEDIIKNNPGNIVVIDEAYVDFGGETCIPLIRKYDNLIVTRTFSKSRSMAGARLGFGIASKELIKDMNTVRFSTNPYNINSMTMAAGIGALGDEEYTAANIEKVKKTREATVSGLRKLGFEVPDSTTNFLFVKHSKITGEDFYAKMKESGILIRHFSVERIKDYNRVTVGTDEQMKEFIAAAAKITEGI